MKPASPNANTTTVWCLLLGHDWRYFEDPKHEYTGYLERCVRCGRIVQVPQ